MQIVFRSEAGEQELDVELRNPEGTVADLVRGVLGRPAPAQVQVAGRVVPSGTLLADSGLHEAAVVDVAPAPPPPATVATSGLELVVVAGTSCGAVLPVPLGRSSVGRGTDNALVVPSRTVSRRHALLDAGLDEVAVTDGASANGTRVRDGAHGLVGGTTGPGKSELLRSLVAALAAHADPQHLTFVLVDYKGGAAFDVCARLPHTVGLVTDLDEQLGERALLVLEAELKALDSAVQELQTLCEQLQKISQNIMQATRRPAPPSVRARPPPCAGRLALPTRGGAAR